MLLIQCLMQVKFSRSVKPFLEEIEMSSVNCSQSFHSKIHKTGYIQSPNYPSEYPNKLFCIYEFFGDTNEHVIISVEDFELEAPKLISIFQSIDFNLTMIEDELEKEEISKTINNSNFEIKQCFNDYFETYNYNFKYYELNKRYCGNEYQKQIVANVPQFRIIFSSDEKNQFKGFKLKFYFSLINISPFITSDSLCGFNNITGEGGLISSPYYPKIFPSPIECAWTITVDREKKILINFKDLNFNEPCSISYVHIWDGYMNKINEPDEIFCQKLLTRNIKFMKTKSNRVVIKFNGNRVDKNEKSNANSGFLIHWTSIREDEKCEGDHDFKCKGSELCIDEKKSLCSKINSYCISKKLVCNGYTNCATGDNSDEENCSTVKGFDLFGIKIVIIFFLTVIVVFTIIFFGILTFVMIATNKKSRKNLENGDFVIEHINNKILIDDFDNKSYSRTCSASLNESKIRNSISNPILISNKLPTNFDQTRSSECLKNKINNENTIDKNLKCIAFLNVEVNNFRSNSYTKAINSVQPTIKINEKNISS